MHAPIFRIGAGVAIVLGLCGCLPGCRGPVADVSPEANDPCWFADITDQGLYRNVAPKRGHWLMVRAVDPALKRDAYGAEITVPAGDRRWLRCINPGYSYLCSNDPRAHFGLGGVDRLDRIDIIWPDGTEETFPGRPADQLVLLRKGEGKEPGK